MSNPSDRTCAAISGRIIAPASGAYARKSHEDEGKIGDLGVDIGSSAPMAFFHFGGWKGSFFGDRYAQGRT